MIIKIKRENAIAISRKNYEKKGMD